MTAQSLNKSRLKTFVIGSILILAITFFISPAIFDVLLIANFVISIIFLLSMKSSVFNSHFSLALILITLFRFTLNLCSTKLILLSGSAGMVVNYLGNFFIDGNCIKGFTIFAILVVINITVLIAASKKVFEVSKTSLNKLSENDKNRDFFENTIKTAKYMRFEAIAAVLFIIINIVGGMYVGVYKSNLDVQTAFSIYSVLTIGAGIATQIPELLTAFVSGFVFAQKTNKEE